MHWILLSLIAVLNRESVSQIIPPNLLLNGKSLKSMLDVNTARPSKAIIYPKFSYLKSSEEGLEHGRKKRYFELEVDPSFSSFHRMLPIPKQTSRWAGHSEENQNIRMKRIAQISKEKIYKQWRKREEIPKTKIDTKADYEVISTVDKEVSTIIDQKPFIIETLPEPAPHVYIDDSTGNITVNSRMLSNAKSTSQITDAKLYTHVQYNNKEDTDKDINYDPIQDDVSVAPSNIYELTNLTHNSKLLVDQTLNTVNDSKTPIAETLVNLKMKVIDQINIEKSVKPKRPGYPELILPKEIKTKIDRKPNLPETLGKPTTFKKVQPKIPFVTPFNPYTTLFLPSSGTHLYHLPLQIPILNMPLSPLF